MLRSTDYNIISVREKLLGNWEFGIGFKKVTSSSDRGGGGGDWA
jgi:hypothetical protein